MPNGFIDISDELITWKLTYDIREKAFGIVQAFAYDVTVNPQILRAREILANEAEYLSWFQRSEIGEPSEQIASTGDTDVVEVKGVALEESQTEKEQR